MAVNEEKVILRWLRSWRAREIPQRELVIAMLHRLPALKEADRMRCKAPVIEKPRLVNTRRSA